MDTTTFPTETYLKVIRRNNNLLAEFTEYPGNGQGQYLSPYDTSENLFTSEHLPFHSDWNWLMGVVNRINNLIDNETEAGTWAAHPYQVIIEPTRTLIEGGGVLIEENVNEMLTNTYFAVVEFIKQFNQRS